VGARHTQAHGRRARSLVGSSGSMPRLASMQAGQHGTCAHLKNFPPRRTCHYQAHPCAPHRCSAFPLCTLPRAELNPTRLGTPTRTRTCTPTRHRRTNLRWSIASLCGTYTQLTWAPPPQALPPLLRLVCPPPWASHPPAGWQGPAASAHMGASECACMRARPHEPERIPSPHRLLSMCNHSTHGKLAKEAARSGPPP